MTFKIAFFLLLISLLVSCAKEEKIEDKKIFAYSILNPKFKNQLVIVDSLYDISQTPVKETLGASGAEVMVVNESDGDTTFFIEKKSGFYEDTLKEFWVKPLKKYRLWVLYQGETLTAQTFVPDTFRFITPKNNETLSYQTLPPFSWQKSKNATAYWLMIFHPDTARPTFPFILKDTILDLTEEKKGIFDTQAVYLAKIYAWDENRYRWALKRGAYDTLYQGLGHFSSQTEDTVLFYLKKDARD